MLHTGNHLSDKDKHYLSVEDWKTIFQANGPRKQAGIAILILDKIDFQPKGSKKDMEEYIILNKEKNLPSRTLIS